MRAVEARIVKRKLASYLDMVALAARKDHEALMTHELYATEAGAKGIKYDPKIGGGHSSSRESRLLTILSEQIALDQMAAKYRQEAKNAETFIKTADVSTKERTILEKAFLLGKRYREIAEEENYCTSGVGRLIDRIIESVPEEFAETCGLL